MPPQIITSLCNQCLRETQHDVVSNETQDVEDLGHFQIEIKRVVVRCRGCGDVAVRSESWWQKKGEFGHVLEQSCEKVRFDPPRVWRRAPNWLSTIEQQEPDLAELLQEVYSAANDQQVRLLSMGVRAVLDHVMTAILGADVGGFEAKLDALVEKDHLTRTQRDNLSIVIDAGSASSHRGFKPNPELVEEMLVAMENIIRDHYITGPMLKTARTQIPPRPRRRKRNGS